MNQNVELIISNPSLWSPDSPYLYDLRVTVDNNNGGGDTVLSYFGLRTFELQKDDTIYIFSDGFADQFGGEKGKKFRTVSFKESVLELETIDIQRRGIALEQKFHNWKGSLEQLDDVCVFGIQILDFWRE